MWQTEDLYCFPHPYLEGKKWWLIALLIDAVVSLLSKLILFSIHFLSDVLVGIINWQTSSLIMK